MERKKEILRAYWREKRRYYHRVHNPSLVVSDILTAKKEAQVRGEKIDIDSVINEITTELREYLEKFFNPQRRSRKGIADAVNRALEQEKKEVMR